MGQFEFDVAFSFLDSDLDLVRKVESRLEGRFKTFVYPDHQAKLVGTNGQESFKRVFEVEARTAIVMFRDGWGVGGMTGAEMLGMRDRGFRQLYDWLLVVVLDEGRPSLPEFIPKTNIYWHFPTYGLDGVSAAIALHVARNGGEALEPSIEGKMVAARKARALEESRRKYREETVRSEQGWFMEHAFMAEGKRFQRLLIERAKAVRELPLQLSGEPGQVVRIEGLGAGVATTWRTEGQTWFMWGGFTKMDEGLRGARGSRDVGHLSCHPDLNTEHEPGWRVGDRWLSSDQLAEHILRRLADHMSP